MSGHTFLSLRLKQVLSGIVNLLSELSVDGENLRVADESEGQDGDGVRRLKPQTHQRSVTHPHTHTRREREGENPNKTSQPES